jgi:hypothetical protein
MAALMVGLMAIG